MHQNVAVYIYSSFVTAKSVLYYWSQKSGTQVSTCFARDNRSKRSFQDTNAVKKIYSINLRYAGSEYSDWLKNLDHPIKML